MNPPNVATVRELPYLYKKGDVDLTDHLSFNGVFLVSIAPFIGSFLAVLVRRLPKNRPIILARSECESCNRRLAFWELIPLLSFILLWGRCRTCSEPIPRALPIIELAAIGVAVWVIWVVSDPRYALALCVLGWALLVLSFIDASEFYLPDILTLPLIVIGLVVTLLLNPADLLDRTLGVISGYTIFCAISKLYQILRGRDGLGEGDAKLMAVSGAWLGMGALVEVIFIAALIGLLVALLGYLKGLKVNGGTPLPFGPPLSVAIWLQALHGPLIMKGP